MQSMNRTATSVTRVICLVLVVLLVGITSTVEAQKKSRKKSEPVLEYPPKLADGQTILEAKTTTFLQPPSTLRDGVVISKTPPRVEFMYYPGQNYPGKPWSNWGDSTFANGKYYSTIGDHLAIGNKGDGTHGNGTALVFEYDPKDRKLRQLANISETLNLPKGHYAPGKIHTRIDMGHDGWLYYATHRGSIRSTKREFHYKGDWILRTHPTSRRTEIVAHAPVPFHAIPNGILDPQRLIFYGGTAAAHDREDEGIHFFAYDTVNEKTLHSEPDGPARYMMFSPTTGCVYFVRGKGDGPLMRFDPKSGKGPTAVKGANLGMRAATRETENGMIFTVSLGQKSADTAIWAFSTKDETAKQIGTAAVGGEAYVATMSTDAEGRFLYYIPGAHGGSYKDGTPIVQFNIANGRKKVIAFLEPYFTKTHGMTLKGTYGLAIDSTGEKLFVTWNVSRGSRAWDCCGLTVIHIPESER